MKQIIFFTLFSFVVQQAFTQQNSLPLEYKTVTIVESILTMGVGRSRIIENQSEVDVDDFTTERIDGVTSFQGKIKRRNIKIDKFIETKLLNFYSLGGINFRNIASNDAVITSKINQLAKKGWNLLFVTSGVESVGYADREGIFITRLIFVRPRR